MAASFLESSPGVTATDNQRIERQTDGIRVDSAQVPEGLDAPVDAVLTLPRRGLLDRDWQKALIVLLTLLASVAVLWVIWQIVSPILHTLVLFALAAVLAFALSGPVDMLSHPLATGWSPSWPCICWSASWLSAASLRLQARSCGRRLTWLPHFRSTPAIFRPALPKSRRPSACTASRLTSISSRYRLSPPSSRAGATC